MARLKLPKGAPSRQPPWRARELPYAYRPGKGLLYRLPAALKLLLLLSLSLAAFFFGFPALLLSAALLSAGALSVGLRPWSLLRGIRPLLITVLLVLAFRSLSPTPVLSGFNLAGLFDLRGFIAGLRFALTVIESFAAGALLFRVTTMTEIRESLAACCTCGFFGVLRAKRNKLLGRLERRLLPSRRTPRLSLALALMLGFLPRFFEIWETLTTAYDARSGKAGLPRILTLVPLAAERMIESAAETAGALESRGL
jgi:biotin transport system permease protein